MDELQKDLVSRVTKLERELKVWRLGSFLLIMTLAAAAVGNSANDKSREIELTSEDGKLKASLSPYGLRFTWNGREIAGLKMESIGDGDQKAGKIEFSSADDRRAVLSEGGLRVQSADPYHRGVTIRGPKEETSIASSGVMVPGGQFGVDQEGLVRLQMFDQDKLIAAMGAMGTFVHSVPRKKDSAALLLNDFGPDGKSHFITPSESVVRGKANNGQKN